MKTSNNYVRSTCIVLKRSSHTAITFVICLFSCEHEYNQSLYIFRNLKVTMYNMYNTEHISQLCHLFITGKKYGMFVNKSNKSNITELRITVTGTSQFW